MNKLREAHDRIRRGTPVIVSYFKREVKYAIFPSLKEKELYGLIDTRFRTNKSGAIDHEEMVDNACKIIANLPKEKVSKSFIHRQVSSTLHFFRRELKDAIFPWTRKKTSGYQKSPTRGNVTQRIGGVISEEEHHEIVRKGREIAKNL